MAGWDVSAALPALPLSRALGLGYTRRVYKLTTLENGVRLLLVPVEGVASVSVGVYAACGSRYEPEEISGVSHFLEHMAFKGTRKYPTYDDVHAIERLGGRQNAYTSVDITKFYAKVLAEDWEKTLDVTADLALNPALPEKDFDQERRVIIEEMMMYEDDLPAKSGEAYHGLVYGDNSLGRRTIGTKESLARVNKQAMHDFHDSRYQAGDLVVAVSGKIESEFEIEKRVRELFGGLEKKKNAGFENIVFEQRRPRVELIEKPKAEQANLIIGFRTCGRKSEDRFPLMVFNLLMGSGFTSRLFKRIREEKGLCYAISSDASFYDETGDWAVGAGVATERIDEAIEAIMAEIKLIIDHGVKEEELAISKKRYEAAAAFRMESPDGLGEFFGTQVVYGMPILTLEDYLAKIRSVTLSDIERVVKKYFVNASLNLAVVGRFRKKDKERWGELLGAVG